MAKTEKAKSVKGSAAGGKSLGGAPAKKKGRRLKRSIRRTLGTLFLISALVVAAIPVDNLRASDGNDGIMPYAESLVDANRADPVGVVPTFDIPRPTEAQTQNIKIYTTEDRMMEFIYFPNSSGDYVAVVVRYKQTGNLEGNRLDIPNQVSAYRMYTSTSGQNTTSSYAAVGANSNFLFYRARRSNTYKDEAELNTAIAGTEGVKVVSRTTIYEADNVTIKEIQVTEEYGNYIPCYLDQKEAWVDRDNDWLYYDNSHPFGEGFASDVSAHSQQIEPVETNQDYWRLKDVTLNYIADYYYTVGDTVSGNGGSGGSGITWHDVTKGEEGLFHDRGNIYYLSFGKDLVGIGDYAFYNCYAINSVSFGNGLNALGTGAFEQCVGLTSVELAAMGSLTSIGARAFYNCYSMGSFTVPQGVTKIGNSAFEGCEHLASIDLCSTAKGEGTAVLNELGNDIFVGCKALTSITFPPLCNSKIYISSFRGCTSLNSICARGDRMQILEDKKDDNNIYYSYESFKKQLSKDNELGLGDVIDGEFYFAGVEGSWLHNMTKENCFAFRYINGTTYEPEDFYELTIRDEESGDPAARNTFVVTSPNRLYEYRSEGNVSSLIIPATIGPRSIATIDAGVFANQCNLETVVIPHTVTAIGDGAFKGCHRLTNVIFTGYDVNSDANVSVGANAFQTQDYNGGAHKCSEKSVEKKPDGTPKNELYFTGPISPSFGPYTYAMSQGGAYSSSGQNQTTSYITYYSGWPTNLEVRYDPDTNMSVLEDFPALSELGTYTSDKYKYLDMPGAEKENGKTAYETAIESAYNNYVSGASLIGDQPKLIDAALNLVIPDGVDAVREGLIYKKEQKDIAMGPNNTTPEKTVTAYSLREIKRGEETTSVSGGNGSTDIIGGTGTFGGCEHLTKVSLLQGREGVATVIDDYAFQGCTGLREAEIAENISDIGECPFYKCDALTDINFQNSPYYIFSKGIIYGLEGGNKTSVVECLGSRTDYINGAELSGITSLRPAAFKGSNVKEINLSKTTVKTLPARVFEDTKEVNKITMPSTVTSIEEDAFKGSTVEYIVASSSLAACHPSATSGLVDKAGNPRNPKDVTWCCIEGDDLFVNRYGVLQQFNITHDDMDTYYTVIFRDWDAELGRNVQVDVKEDVLAGTYVKPPKPRGRDDEGMMFDFWEADDGVNTYDYVEDFQVGSNLTITAQYRKAGEDYNKIKVTFLDYDGTTILKTDWVFPGGDAVPPSDPKREGYRFTGWMPAFTNITEPVTTMAQYALVKEGECVVRYIIDDEVFYTTTVMAGSTAPPIQLPTIEGKTFSKWLPALGAVFGDTDYYAIYVDSSSDPNDPNNPNNPNNPDDPNNPNNPNNPSNSPTPSNSPNPDDNKPTSKFYTLTVRNGSGSGSYVEDSHPIIIANDPASGQEFSSWTIDPSDTEIASRVLSATVITMPDKDVTVTANYKAKTSSSSGNGTTGSSNSSKTPGTTSSVKKGGTTVVINKNGLSNTGVVSATVNGSSDNFTVKINESATASDAIVRALQAEYGSDLSRIVYFPMDISLYDSTGQTKITDTTGLSISITLPLPDSLITYAGNNKVAGVVNDKLDKLSPKFTTISGVSCITFTATHFSPYVIYVDTGNLNASAMADNTPKTGDGIHPKWFLSMGLGCASIVMFMKKDKRKPKKKLAKI